MAKVLDTYAINHRLAELIKNSKKELILISPYLKFSERVRDLLVEKNDEGVMITLVARNGIYDEELEFLDSLKNLNLKYRDSLHAKCYLNESEAIITSMNLHNFSQENNYELGIYLNINDDKALFSDLKIEASRISNVNSILKKATSKQSFVNHVNKSENKSKGYCIRCSNSIELNGNKPLCRKCFDIWKDFEDDLYPEKYCHHCGNKNKTSLAYPFCKKCYNKHYKNESSFNFFEFRF